MLGGKILKKFRVKISKTFFSNLYYHCHKEYDLCIQIKAERKCHLSMKLVFELIFENPDSVFIFIK